MMWNTDFWWPMGMGYGFHGIFMLLFVVLLVWLAVMLLRATARPAAATMPQRSALEILAERYARGELTREQFEAMRRDLNGLQ